MRDARIQYFLTYGTLGTVLPYISVFFVQAGLTRAQVGWAFAILSLASILSPAFVTFLADRAGDPRRLLGIASALTAACLAMVCFSRGAPLVLTTWTLYCLASMPIFPLQDGIHFSQQRRRNEQGHALIPYHLVRVWGTIGYILPNLAMLGLFKAGMSLRGVLIVGAGLAGLAAIQTFFLRDPRPRAAIPADADQNDTSDSRMPTFGAARILFGPHLIAFTAAIVLMNMATQIHSAFYPIYLTEQIHLKDIWLGQASNLAVAVETLVLFACGWLIRSVGLKRLLLLAILFTALRMGLLGLTSSAWITIGSQVFHGLLVLAVGVLPQAIFNDCAEDRYRHSMQGMLVMVTSAGRVVASPLAGLIATHSLAAVFNCTGGMCVAAAVLVVIGFHESRLKPRTTTEDELPVEPVTGVTISLPERSHPDASSSTA